MPACLLNLTLDQTVTQYGLLSFGIFNLSIVTGKLFIVSNHIVKYFLNCKISVNRRSGIYIMFLSATILTLCYPFHVRKVHLPSLTYLLGDEEETGGLPGTKKSTKYREEIFILNYLNLLLTKRIMIISDVYLFMPLNLSF